MKAVKCLERHENIERGIHALYKELGPMETRRFMVFTRPPKREESVKRHRNWTARVDRIGFLREIRAAYSKARKK